MFEFFDITTTLVSSVVICVTFQLIYSTIMKNWNYFSDRNVVFERGYTIAGTMLGNFDAILGRKSMAESCQDLYNRHPTRKFVGMYEPGGAISYFIRDPDLIRDITIKDFEHFTNRNFRMDKQFDPLLGRSLFSMLDQPWREMRSTVTPLFTGSKMRFMLSLMIDCAHEFNAHIREEIDSKSPAKSLEFDMMELIMRLSSDMIGSVAFGIKINTLKDPDNEFYKMGKEIANAFQSLKVIFLIAFPKLSEFLKLQMVTTRQDNFFRSLLLNTIEERNKNNIVRNDMLHLVLLAKEGKLNADRECDQDTGFATVSEFITPMKEKLKNWTDVDLLAQSIVFFLAGFAGLSSSFCFMCYELSLNPDIQERLYEEIVQTNEQLKGKSVTFEAIQKMKYLDMVVSETLRKWPIGTMMDRSVSKRYVLQQNDGSTVELQPNDIVWIPTYAIQRDPNLHPNPNTFDPERFSDENKKNIQPASYIPFGIGPRQCIASRFSLLQLKAVMFYLLLEFKIEVSPKTPIPLKLKPKRNPLDAMGGFFNQIVLRN